METSKNQSFPPSVRACLWSYDLRNIHLRSHQNLIITQVMNFGSKEATDWLQEHYSVREIREVVEHPLPGMWSKKSLNFWSIVYGIQPKETARPLS